MTSPTPMFKTICLNQMDQCQMGPDIISLNRHAYLTPAQVGKIQIPWLPFLIYNNKPNKPNQNCRFLNSNSFV